MNEIDKEIEQMAEALEKASKSPKEQLFETIKQLGSEGLKKKLSTLNPDDKVILKSALEEMKKAVEFDKEAQSVKFINGRVADTIIQEEVGNDDVDETLVKLEAAKHNHQGGPVDGWEGQVIKGKDDLKKDVAIDEKDVKAKKDPKAKEEEKKMMKKSDETLEEVKKSDDAMYSMVSKMMKKCGGNRKMVMDKCMSKGMDKDKISSMMDRAMKEHEKNMHGKDMKKSDEIEKGKMKMLAEEGQSGDTAQMTEGESRAKKENVEALDVAGDNKKAQDKVDDVSQGKMQKSISWNDRNLLKAKTGGRNYHFNVGDYLEAKTKEIEPEPVKKSESTKVDLNDMIAKSMDKSLNDMNTEVQIKENTSKVNGKLVKSFEIKELAETMGLTEEEARKIIGE